jgi:hypothetical protein
MPTAPLPNQLVATATTQVGVKETKGNRGPKIKEYLNIVGLGEGYAWCAGFVCWCVAKTSQAANVVVKLQFSAGVLAMWNKNKELRVADPLPGDIFIMKFSNGLGHTGIVTGVTATEINTIEGNTNDGGSREGDGVYKRKRLRKTIHGYLRPFLLLLLPFFGMAQLNTKDTLINSRWVRMSIPTNYNQVDSLPMIVFFPGRGEVGTGLISDTSKISVGGPHGFIKQGWNGHVVLAKDTIRPLILTVQVSDWQGPSSIVPIFEAIQRRFTKVSSIHFTGLSMGSWSGGGVIMYRRTSSDTLRPRQVKSMVSVKGVHFGDTAGYIVGVAEPHPQRFRTWANRGGKYLIIESSGDLVRGGRELATNIGNGATYVLSDIGSAGHGAFNWFYGGGGRQPSTIPVGGAQQTIYQWMMRQGDTTVPGSTPPPAPLQVSIVASADTITLPTDSVTLTAYPATGYNYSWKQVSGPTMVVPLPLTSTVKLTGLQPGRYTFEVTLSQAAQAATRQININVLPSPSYTILGTYLLIQYPGGAIELKKQ